MTEYQRQIGATTSTVDMAWKFPSAHSFRSKTSLQLLAFNKKDVLLESGKNLSDIIVNLCSKLLCYVFLKSGNNNLKCHNFGCHLLACAWLNGKTKARFEMCSSCWSLWYMVHLCITRMEWRY